MNFPATSNHTIMEHQNRFCTMIHVYTGDPMETMTLRLWPDDSLKKVCDPVENFDHIEDIANEMAEIMYRNNGMGLAANQVGLNMRLFLMDRGGHLMVFVNPRVLQSSGDSYEAEGCLSFPGVRERVKRASTVLIEAQDAKGSTFRETFHRYEARCVLHEIDHLNGITWFDRMGSLQRKKAKQRLLSR